MENEKRMIGDYTVLQAFRIGEYEIALCENPNAADKTPDTAEQTAE